MGKKIALFTTIGKLSEESKVHVNASFSSWSKYGFDVIVFGEDFHEEICKEYGFILDTEYERSEFNIPLVRGLFQKALTYTDYDVLCYLNSDIIFASSPRKYIDEIEFDSFMAVGQRLDVWNYPNVTKKELHNPGGIDYFFFTPNFRDWSDMPDFSIARGRFDHWLMGASLEINKPVIDLSQVFVPIHPEPKNRITAEWWTLYAENNYKLAYQILRNTWYYAKAKKHGQTDMTPFFMTEDGLLNRITIPKNEYGRQYEFDIRL